jgi:hypothetical protein
MGARDSLLLESTCFLALVACASPTAPASALPADLPPPAPAASASASPSVTSSATAASPPPAGWWAPTHVAGREQEAAALSCSETELTFVGKQGTVVVRPAKLSRSGAGRWEWTVTAVRATVTCVLERTSPSSGALRCTDGVHPAEEMTLDRISDAARTASLDAVVAKNKPRVDACALAEACGPKAFNALNPGGTFRAEDELGNPPVPDQCEKFLRGIQTIFESVKKTPPKECPR